MRRKKIISIFCCTLFLLFAMPLMAEEAVKESHIISITSYRELLGKEYQMTSPFSEKLLLGFDVHNRVYGYTGLNRFWGQAEIQNGKIKVQDVAMTENKGTQEQRILQVKYLTLLKDAERIYLEGENLVLMTPFQEKLIFTRIR